MKTVISTKPLPPLPKTQKMTTYAKITNDIKTEVATSQNFFPGSNLKPNTSLAKKSSKCLLENFKLENLKNSQNRLPQKFTSVRNSIVIDNKSLPIQNPPAKKYAKAIPVKISPSPNSVISKTPTKNSSRQDLNQQHKISNSSSSKDFPVNEKKANFLEGNPKYIFEFDETETRFCGAKNELFKNTASTTERGVSDFSKCVSFDKDDPKKVTLSPFNERSFLETTEKSQVTFINDESVSHIKLKQNKEVSDAFCTLTKYTCQFWASVEKRKYKEKKSRLQILNDLKVKVSFLELRNIGKGFFILQRAVDQFLRSRKRVAMKKLLIIFKN